MKTTFHATRDIARRIAKEEDGHFVDMGKDAPKGKRWAVQFEDLKDFVERIDAQHKATGMNVPTQEDKALNDELMAAFAKLDIQPVLPKPDHVTRRSVSVLKNHKGDDVTVFTKRVIPV